jgi:hypothetical protein
MPVVETIAVLKGGAVVIKGVVAALHAMATDPTILSKSAMVVGHHASSLVASLKTSVAHFGTLETIKDITLGVLGIFGSIGIVQTVYEKLSTIFQTLEDLFTGKIIGNLQIGQAIASLSERVLSLIGIGSLFESLAAFGSWLDDLVELAASSIDDAFESIIAQIETWLS